MEAPVAASTGIEQEARAVPGELGAVRVAVDHQSRARQPARVDVLAPVDHVEGEGGRVNNNFTMVPQPLLSSKDDVAGCVGCILLVVVAWVVLAAPFLVLAGWLAK